MWQRTTGGVILAAAIAWAATSSLTAQSTPATTGAPAPQDDAAKKEQERALIRQVADGLRARQAARQSVPKNWKPARTPWGDPDLSGVYSNSEESGVPLEKPAEFGNRRLEDISPEELARINEARREATIDRAASATEDPNAHPQLFWWENLNPQNSRAWLISDPPDGHVPPLTDQGRRRIAEARAARRGNGFDVGPFDGPEDLSLYDRCISRGVPGSMLPAIYGSSYEIVQGPGYVVLVSEMIHEARTVPIDPMPHVGSRIKSYMGDARGHWEGDTLVVETTNFKDDAAYRNASGETLRLIERFTPAGPEALEWSVTVDDRSTWTRPWTFGMQLTRKDSSQRPLEYACHEGNYGLRNILSAARAAEAVQGGAKGTAGHAPAPPSSAPTSPVRKPQ